MSWVKFLILVAVFSQKMSLVDGTHADKMRGAKPLKRGSGIFSSKVSRVREVRSKRMIRIPI